MSNKPLTAEELDAVECTLRSGILPDLETVQRLVAEVRQLREAERWMQGRVRVFGA